MESKEEMPSGDFSCFHQSKARKCNCTFVQKTVGDGCETCNPVLALSFCKEQNATLIEERAIKQLQIDELVEWVISLKDIVEEYDNEFNNPALNKLIQKHRP